MPDEIARPIYPPRLQAESVRAYTAFQLFIASGAHQPPGQRTAVQALGPAELRRSLARRLHGLIGGDARHGVDHPFWSSQSAARTRRAVPGVLGGAAEA